MKTFKTLTIFIIVILVSVLACKKEEDPTTIISNPTTPTVNPTNQFFSDNLTEAIQLHTVDVSSWTTITGNKGTVIWMGYGSFVDGNGNKVHGFIDVELIEALDNKDMLMLNRPTVTNNGELLISGGIIYINATQNGDQLQIADNLNITMPNVMGGNPTSPLTLWSGNTTANGDFVWIEDTTNTLWADSSYYFDVDTIGWTNLDAVADLGQGATSNVSVVLPSGLNGNNSAVMIYFTTINSFASIYDGNADGTFELGGYTIPIGANPKFVVISMVNNDWSYYVSPNIPIIDPFNLDILANEMLPATSEQDVQDQIVLLLQ